jgi:hypothetical protein
MALPDENSLLKKEHQAAEDEIEVAVEGDGIEIEVVDDTPPADRNRKPLPEGEAEPSDDEMEEYSENVKRRIAKMKHALHDERRAKEAAAREREAAIDYAKRIFEEKRALESRYTQGEDAFIGQAKEKAALAMDAAKREYKAAYELGDADKMADAQEKMAIIASEKKDAESWARNAAQRKENAGQKQQDMVQSRQPSQVSAPEPDPDAKDWAAKNKWFGADGRMTNMAYAIHDELIAEGIDPALDADKYYKKLNSEMRASFPSYDWGDAPKKKPTSVVAPVVRTSKTARRVTLTQSQVAVARRMGITPQQYAVELAKLSEN